jgi:hypothetical protein
MNVETRSSQAVHFNRDAHTEGKRHGNFLPAIFLFSFLIILPLMPIGSQCAAQTLQALNQPQSAQTTLAIFTDPHAPRISDGLWTALVAALDRELISGDSETNNLINHAVGDMTKQTVSVDTSAHINIVRGDTIASGVVIDNSISVYIHGECVAMPTPRPEPIDREHIPPALGWVRVHNGVIEPFIHVECTQISRVLGLQGMGVKGYQRDQLMAQAIAHVIAHEWIHISTQSKHHGKNGITKAQFGFSDLVAHTSKPREKHGKPSPATDQSGGADCSLFPDLHSPAQPCLKGTK